MHFHVLAAGILAGFAAITPATALAQVSPSPAPAMSGMPQIPASMLPFSQPDPLESAHVWVTDGASKRELHAAKAQVAQTNVDGMPGAGSVAGSMAKGLATTALAVAAGPIGMVASSVFNLFGHHPSARPKYHAMLALAGQQSSTALRSDSTTFECNYASIPGIDPAPVGPGSGPAPVPPGTGPAPVPPGMRPGPEPAYGPYGCRYCAFCAACD